MRITKGTGWIKESRNRGSSSKGATPAMKLQRTKRILKAHIRRRSWAQNQMLRWWMAPRIWTELKSPKRSSSAGLNAQSRLPTAATQQMSSRTSPWPCRGSKTRTVAKSSSSSRHKHLATPERRQTNQRHHSWGPSMSLTTATPMEAASSGNKAEGKATPDPSRPAWDTEMGEPRY